MRVLAAILLSCAINCFGTSAFADVSTNTWDENYDQGAKAFRAGRLADAEKLFSAALHQAEKFPATNARLPTSINNLALVYKEQGKLKEAEPLFSRTVSMQEKILPPNHPYLAAGISNLAEVNALQNRLPQADKLYRRALNIYEHGGLKFDEIMLNPKYKATTMENYRHCLQQYSGVLLKLGKNTEALKLRQRISTEGYK